MTTEARGSESVMWCSLLEWSNAQERKPREDGIEKAYCVSLSVVGKKGVW